MAVRVVALGHPVWLQQRLYRRGTNTGDCNEDEPSQDVMQGGTNWQKPYKVPAAPSLPLGPLPMAAPP